MDELSRELRPPLTPEAAVVEADRCLECGGAHAQAPVRDVVPRGSRRAELRRLDRGRRPWRSRGDDLRREHPRRHVRARLPRRGALSARLRAHPRGPPADRDRRAPALRDRMGVRERRAPTHTAAAERQARRGDRRRAGRPGRGRRARRTRLLGDRARRARGDRRARPLRDRAVPPVERAAAGRGAAAHAISASSSGWARASTQLG